MKVKELIKQLEEMDPEKEVRISLRKGYRPMGTRSINSLDFAIDQDTNELSFYIIDVNIEIEYPVHEERIITPKDKIEYE